VYERYRFPSVADVLVPAARTRRRRRRRSRRPALLAVLLVVAVPLGLAARDLLHRGETMPGVRVLDADVGGLDRPGAAAAIRAATARRLAEPVTLNAGGKSVRVTPKLLFMLDRRATTDALLRAGRESWTARARSLLSPLTDAPSVAPVLVERPAARRTLAALLARFARPPVPASVAMHGTEPRIRASRPGSAADLTVLLRRLERRVAAGEGAVPVSFAPTAHRVGDADARTVAADARLVVSAPVALTFDGRPVGALSPETLARLLRFRAHAGRLVAVLDEDELARSLEGTLDPWERDPVDASFAVTGSTVGVVPAQDGLALDARAALVSVTTAAHAHGERAAALRLGAIPADLTTGEAQALGISEQISSFTTDMGPSSANRIHNVHLMADYVDGTVILPGETFSFNDSVGPRTPERGFREGQMIVGSLLLPAVGGGVCQTATTLFNNAFELGLPIEERHNHSFYISHYPMGRDATVSWGGPDFKFRNDMAHGLLIKASYTDSTLTFSFYGTDEGRSVSASTGPQENFQEPRLTYALDPAAPSGSVRVERGSHQSGFDVTVYRTVTRDGAVLRSDSFTSTYIPVGDTAIYGPGRAIPGPYFVIPTT
jgi:vancomycin resistance protein YoaR